MVSTESKILLSTCGVIVPLTELMKTAKRETLLALTMFVCAIIVWFSMLVFHVASVGGQDPPAFPPRDELAGIDPAAQMIMKDRAKMADLERRLATVERLNALQVRQIDQLQRFTFGPGAIGSSGAKSDLIQTPDELSGQSVVEPIGSKPPANSDLP